MALVTPEQAQDRICVPQVAGLCMSHSLSNSGVLTGLMSHSTTSEYNFGRALTHELAVSTADAIIGPSPSV